jgi:hypothetical protein
MGRIIQSSSNFTHLSRGRLPSPVVPERRPTSPPPEDQADVVIRLLQLPTELILEVSQRISNPETLLALSRTSKRLRAILTSHSACGVWAACLVNYQNNIDVEHFHLCPNDLNEIQYLALLYDQICSVGR